MTIHSFRFVRLFCAALLLSLAACGGGGGGDGGEIRHVNTPGNLLEGNWQLTVSFDGNAAAPTAVAAADVPSEAAAATFSRDTVAQLEVARFPGKTVSVNLNQVAVSDADTNYQVVVNGIVAINDYQSCGTCAVGTTVSFTITANLTEGGTFDGVAFTTATHNSLLTLRYVRVS